MTRRISIEGSARDDIVNIGDWITTRSDAQVAEAYLSRLYDKLDKLQDFPHRGTDRSGFEQFVRSFTFERRYIILYRVHTDRVEILRVLHAKRDLTGLFSR